MTTQAPPVFANPYLSCNTCGVRVVDFADSRNVPCGHQGYVMGHHEYVEPYASRCPSWGPVDGCTCAPPCSLPPASETERHT